MPNSTRSRAICRSSFARPATGGLTLPDDPVLREVGVGAPLPPDAAGDLFHHRLERGRVGGHEFAQARLDLRDLFAVVLAQKR